MSHHLSAPNLRYPRDDARLDLTDTFVFPAAEAGRTVLVQDSHPYAPGPGTGAGFHPDFTGRENVYLSGSIYGLKRRVIDERLEEIVEFAELDQFIDAMKSVAEEVDESPEIVLEAPHNTRVSRMDETAAARKPVLRWTPKLLPQAAEGVASVAILHAAVRRWSGPAAGLIAAGALAVTPVATPMFRFNNPDALLVLLMTAAAYAMVRATESGRTRWIALAGALLGFGFLAKMLRTNSARMYGWRTALYGTLLPAPEIGRRCRAALAAVQAAGHEVGLHAWDHVTWQDRLDRLPRAAIDAQLDRGIAAFAAIFGGRPRGFAAPAWFCTDEAFAALDARGFDYLSVSRGGAAPFYPRLAGRTLATLEVPTTLPTLDEELGRDGITPENYVSRLVARYRPGHDEVLTVHAETEGLAYRGLFRDLLRRHRECVRILVKRPEVVTDECRALFADGVDRVARGIDPGEHHQAG